jgi:hypothetical protein
VTIDPTSGTNNAGQTIPMTVTVDTSVQGGTYPMYLGEGFNQWVGTLNLQ